ncbi:hypothetical protein DL98DRAFT_647324 [Cadophora sp. DSE1049]|nr:hypothetical protein DL98DRAFT_647324 [Cadophora sp. DSE1049]
MAPGPFCCSSAIPSTLRYLSHLIPKQTVHNPLTKSKSSTPLLTSFLVHLNTNVLPIPITVSEGYSPIFYAIIQVKRSHPLDQSGQDVATGNSKPALSSASSPSTSPISAPSTHPQPTRISSYKSTHSTSSLSPPSFPTGPNTIPVSERYFVPLEKTNEPTSLDPASRVFSRGFREISTREAMESLRFPESGIEIGDGENWGELDGVERLWCQDHGVWFELRVWVREGVV